MKRSPEVSGHAQAKAVNRADLVRWLQRAGESPIGLERVARFAGFELETKKVKQGKQGPQVIQTKEVTVKAHPLYIRQNPPKPSARWFRVTERMDLSELDAVSATQEPLSIQGVGEFSQQDLQLPASRPQFTYLPLVRWTRLWPILKRAASIQLAAEIDLPKAAEQIAGGEMLNRLPKRHMLRWSAELVVLLDFNARTLPFWDDFNALCEALQRVRGRLGLDIRKIGHLPGGPFRRWRQKSIYSQQWKMPPAGTPVLVLSDLGMLEQADSAVRRQWLRFSRQLRTAGCLPFVLAPVSPQHVDSRFPRDFNIALWTHGGRLQRKAQYREGNNQPVVEQLLTLLSPAIRIEPELLRAVRYLLPADEADSGCEAEFWLHPDLQVSAVACAIRDTAVERYRTAFCSQPETLQREVYRLLRLHHAHLFPAVMHEETLNWASLVSRKLAGEFRTDIEQAQQFMRRYARMLYAQRERPDANVQAYGNRHLSRTHLGLREQQPYLGVVYTIANRDALRDQRELSIPLGIDCDEVLRALASKEIQPRNCTLRQHGQVLVLESTGSSSKGATSPGSFYADLTLASDGLLVQKSSFGETESAPWRHVNVRNLPQSSISIDWYTETIRLHTGRESLVLSSLTRPDWAQAIGRDSEGLFTEVFWLQARRRLYWQPPDGEQPGQWAGDGALGVDETGLYADVTIEGVTQRFRWIVPGTFLMGSPEDEPERYDNERQHEVKLSEGFWLADTACTQAMWQAVMRDNPSEFKDDPRNPVENVGWDDTQHFIVELNQRVLGLQARLPTEAEWEYACRAGTITPFSFGENITTDQVNYNGDYSYAGGEKGLNRERTVPVGSLPPNPWGLYEMHGNVWEWCGDWYGEYPNEPQIDQPGPENGVFRVLRGGSWFDISRSARSAFRDGDGPGFRNGYFGFRLALGQAASKEAEPDRQERAAGQPRGRRGGQAERQAKSEKLTDRIKDFFKRK